MAHVNHMQNDTEQNWEAGAPPNRSLHWAPAKTFAPGTQSFCLETQPMAFQLLNTSHQEFGQQGSVVEH